MTVLGCSSLCLHAHRPHAFCSSEHLALAVFFYGSIIEISPWFDLLYSSQLISSLQLFKGLANMHVLLLKEPRDGESGPDPYIKVNALLVRCRVHICFCTQKALTGSSSFDSSGVGNTWT